MNSAIAILTYRRLHALQDMLKGVSEHCPQYPTAIFEDCGQRDGTAEWLRHGRHEEPCPDMLARRWVPTEEIANCPSAEVYLGERNLGVSGNSNRAIRWLLSTDCDHLLLCNDDLLVLGDFAKFYAQAHADLGIGLFCFNDFWESPLHRWVVCRSRGYRLKVFRQMTGIMMSVTRQAVEQVGYFDTRFGKFGQEHCDWTNRLRFKGHMNLDGTGQACIDVEPTMPNGDPGNPVLQHQNVMTSVTGAEREAENKLADLRIQEAAARYADMNFYLPYALVSPSHVGGIGSQGIPAADVPLYRTVVSS